MSTPVVPRDLPLPPNQRAQFACGEQRKQKLKEHMLKRKTFFAYKQENQILSSSRNQRVMASEGQVQEETKALKLKAKMDDKENVHRPTKSKNNITMEKTCIPLKPSKELTNSTIVIDAPNLENNNQTLQSLPIKNEPQGQRLTLSQTFHIKNNNKKKQVATEKPKQDANMLKKPVLGSYRGQIVQSKVNSFRKPAQVKDESSAAANKLAATVSKATKPQPASTSSVPGKSHRAPAVMISTKSASTTSQSKQLLRPPIRRHYSNARDTQDSLKQGISRPSFHVTIRKGSRDKEIAQLNPVSSSVKASSFQEVKRNKTLLSRSITSEIIARPASLSNTRLIEQSKTIDQRRHTIAKATIDSRSAQPKETAAERKARLGEWRASKGRALKRPPSSAAAQPPSAGQEGKPVGSFWTTMAEEDEQRLFTEKVNKTFSECLNLINEGCPKEEILGTLNDLVKDIPDAKKLVKYWICLARIEPLTSSIENIISIYEKAILAGAQGAVGPYCLEAEAHDLRRLMAAQLECELEQRVPTEQQCKEKDGALEQKLENKDQSWPRKLKAERPIEEMRHAIVDILTMKSQEKVKLGENFEEACTTKEQIQEAHPEDTGVNVESEKPEMENKHHRSVVFQDCEKEHIDKTKDPTNDAKTPNTETRNSCLIKYNVSTTPYLQSVKKKMQFDEINSTLKELKFLTPVRRSRRLQDKTSKLPDMLKDHYPCVSSLEQLTELGDEMDAFICRPNAALCRMYLETETTSEK